MWTSTSGALTEYPCACRAHVQCRTAHVRVCIQTSCAFAQDEKSENHNVHTSTTSLNDKKPHNTNNHTNGRALDVAWIRRAYGSGSGCNHCVTRTAHSKTDPDNGCSNGRMSWEGNTAHDIRTHAKLLLLQKLPK